MKTVCKKLLCLMLVAMLLVSAVPAAFATGEGAECTHTDRTLIENGKSTKAPTCEDPGVEVYYCNNEACTDEDHYFTVDVSALGHNYVDGVCSRCEAEDPDYVAPDPCANGHDWDAGVMTTLDTCEAAGVKTFTCKRTDCGETKTEEVNEIIGHTLAGDKCMNRFSDGSKCTFVRETTPTVTGKLVISVYNWDGNNRTWIKDVEKPAGTYQLTEAFASEIYPGQKIKYDWGSKSGNTVTVTDSDVNVVLAVTPLQTDNGKNVYKLRVYANNGTSDYKQIDIYEGEGILAAIKNAGIKPTYEDHVLVGYLNNHTGTSKSYLTIYDVADGDDADNGVIKVYADWREKTDDDDEDFEYGEGGGLYGDDNDDPIYDVVLYIYTNGKTSSYAKKVTSSTMGKHTKDGVLSRDEVQMVVENYFKTYDDTKYYGLFTKYYWNSGNYLTENAKYSIELDPDETNYVYVMVKNAKAYVADSSNPKTGDSIMIAVSTMTLAAAALVSMVELKKRKMI